MLLMFIVASKSKVRAIKTMNSRLCSTLNYISPLPCYTINDRLIKMFIIIIINILKNAAEQRLNIYANFLV